MMLVETTTAFLLVIDVQDRLLPAIANKDVVERNCAILMKAASQLGVPAIVSEQYPKGLGKTVPALAELVGNDAIFAKMASAQSFQQTNSAGFGESGSQRSIAQIHDDAIGV